MEWLFGAKEDTSVKLSKSSNQGRSAPEVADDSVHKARGNEFFRQKEYADAIEEYTLGIAICPTATLYSNRSAAHCAIDNFRQARKDADEAIKLDPTWAKTYSRKGKALYGMQSYKQAADAYAKALELSLQGAKGDAARRDAELQALERQTQNQSDAYLRLLEENKQLQRQVEDYEHLFGDWSKKEL